MSRENPTIWGCDHLYPIVIDEIEGGERASCLGYGTSGPVRADAEQALRAEARYVRKPGAYPSRPPIHSTP